MYGDNKDCPIRITSFVGFSFSSVSAVSDALIKEAGWKHHSWASNSAFVYPGVTVHSRILFHLGDTECPKTS